MSLLTKRRTREHIIADLSVNCVERAFLLAGYAVDRVMFDYGNDMTILNGLKYEHIYAILRAQGFTAQAIPQGGEVWRHERGAVLPFPALNPTDSVRSYHYGAVRAMMSDYGFLTPEAFDLALLQLVHGSMTLA